jgi:ATP-binding protein involved in chromosome partitioning
MKSPRNVVQETVNRNENLPASEAVKITTMAGCSAVKKIRKLEN